MDVGGREGGSEKTEIGERVIFYVKSPAILMWCGQELRVFMLLGDKT